MVPQVVGREDSRLRCGLCGAAAFGVSALAPRSVHRLFKRGWCEQKTAADIERELNDILDSGADEIMAFEMDAIVNDPEIYGVFLKYCGKDA